MKKVFPLPKTILREMLTNFIMEDLGYGDITSEILVPAEKRAQAKIYTREECIVSGSILLNEIFEPEGCEIILKAEDGEKLKPNQDIAHIYGPMKGILSRERVTLNLLSRMCGIATQTYQYTQKIPKKSSTVVAATRKTTPGLRLLEKYAVACGGGDSHRLRLDDMVLVKDNHRVLFSSVTAALKEIKKQLSFSKKIEVEVEDFTTLLEAAKGGADIVMLDNMSPEEVKKAIVLLEENNLRDKIILEVSGGININNIAAYAAQGPDVISCGALTHSFKSTDLSLDIIK
jgi:nicotinate-nucleotide pyrophosphorylase (carboxylating)